MVACIWHLVWLQDEGEAARARQVLEGLGAQEKSKAVFAWSLALVELVAWKGEEEGGSKLRSDRINMSTKKFKISRVACV